ncbi:hypothetical protein GDO78_006395 [Eleutherodactylus coqui]|uniref:Uncharacterized protein n=1 Tax=Eleutherodactylus coqui TaxID=57060 RepID=A0A8J6KJN0_ELECQ|nr:hypothetical protein GDO78_006395 [Eleutherodactylus coqui]
MFTASLTASKVYPKYLLCHTARLTTSPCCCTTTAASDDIHGCKSMSISRFLDHKMKEKTKNYWLYFFFAKTIVQLGVPKTTSCYLNSIKCQCH